MTKIARFLILCAGSSGLILGLAVASAQAKAGAQSPAQSAPWFLGEYVGTCAIANGTGTETMRASLSVRSTPAGFSIFQGLGSGGAARVPWDFELTANGAIREKSFEAETFVRNEGTCDERTCVSLLHRGQNGFMSQRTMNWRSVGSGIAFAYRVDASEPSYGGRPARQSWFSHTCQLERVNR